MVVDNDEFWRGPQRSFPAINPCFLDFQHLDASFCDECSVKVAIWEGDIALIADPESKMEYWMGFSCCRLANIVAEVGYGVWDSGSGIWITCGS